MARLRKSRMKTPAQAAESETETIILEQADRSGPRFGEKTLVEIAHERRLMQQADAANAANRASKAARARKPSRDAGSVASVSDEDREDSVDGDVPTLSPVVERGLEASLWTVSLAMLHFTFDVLVQNQYGTEINWVQIGQRTARAWAVMLFLFYALHAFKDDDTLLPGLSQRYQQPLRQFVFFCMSTASGCFLIYVTNSKGYLAMQKQAPPLGCLWLWSVIELDLIWAALSLLGAVGFVRYNGYSFR